MLELSVEPEAQQIQIPLLKPSTLSSNSIMTKRSLLRYYFWSIILNYLIAGIRCLKRHEKKSKGINFIFLTAESTLETCKKMFSHLIKAWAHPAVCLLQAKHLEAFYLRGETLSPSFSASWQLSVLQTVKHMTWIQRGIVQKLISAWLQPK